MKRNTKGRHEYNRISKQYSTLKQEVYKSKRKRLWHYDTVIRSKIKVLHSVQSSNIKDFRQTYKNYVDLLEYISVRLLEQYNSTNSTDYKFDEIVDGNFRAYLNSGIISVLVSNHIPKLIAEEFSKLLPDNPKDEYPQARKMKRRFILHLGETNTGKTYNAIQRLKLSQNGVYLSPLRILALENFERLNAEHIPCNLLTGEEEITVDGALHTSCTVEKANIFKSYEVAVIDEVQLVGNSQRGDAWTRAILGLCCPEIHLCGALLVKEQLIKMIEDCGDDYEIIEYKRLVPLQPEYSPVKMSQIQSGDALVAFSKRSVLSLSEYLTARGINNCVIYGDLPPEVRRLQYDAFLSGESSVLVSTDAIGMGVNLPIRRIIFTETRKFDGEEFRPLLSQEIKQIAGRAGRIGIYDIGYVASTQNNIEFIQDGLETEDDEINTAIVGPSEEIINIGGLPLRDKLALWSTGDEALKYYRKKDIRDYIFILDKLTPYKIPEKIQWRLMLLPFDVHSDALINQFTVYLDECFKMKADELSKPIIKSYSLQAFEEYYQKISLYYSFSKALNMNFDQEWIYETRKQVSEEINRLL